MGRKPLYTGRFWYLHMLSFGQDRAKSIIEIHSAIIIHKPELILKKFNGMVNTY